MKNLKDILEGLGIEIPEDKADALKKEHEANYKTIAEFSKVSDNLKDASEKVTALEADKSKLQAIADKLGDTDPDSIKQMQEDYVKLQNELKDRDAADKAKQEKADAQAKAEKFAESFDKAVGDRKWHSEYDRAGVLAEVKKMHEADDTRGLSDLIEEVTKDKPVWANAHQPANVVPKPTNSTEQNDSRLRAAMGLKNKE